VSQDVRLRAEQGGAPEQEAALRELLAAEEVCMLSSGLEVSEASESWVNIPVCNAEVLTGGSTVMELCTALEQP